MKFSLALPREALSIPVIRRVLGDALRGLGVSEDCIADILVATSEACTNVIQHAGAPVDYEVLASVHDGLCVLKVTDRGAGLPDPQPPDSQPQEPGELSESGRGIKIMRALVDDVSFDTRPEEGTAVYLQKRLTWRDEALMRRLGNELVHSGR